MAFFDKGPSYTDGEGSVRYLDGTALKRPFSIPKKFALIGAIFVLIAAALGGTFIYKMHDTFVNGPQRAMEQLQANLAREVSYDIPILSSLMQLEDAAIRQSFIDSGLTMHELSKPEDNPHGGFDSVKLPEGVTQAQAASMYATGISRLSAADAALMLNGSWTINVSRKDYVDMRIRYCDFDSGTVDDAIANAMKQQGLDESQLGEYGVDEAGNTFQSGVVDINGTFYFWKISACNLEYIYDFYGFPENGVYIGIRITE